MGKRIALGEALQEQRQSGRNYCEFLRKEALSAGIYVLAAKAEDLQRPHQEDEVYYVLSGRARFQAGNQDYPVLPGDLLYIPAGEPHRFHDIEEELRLLVLFAPAETTD
jgi:mannose-6-phosphate isomerase-like protein (cupin superfamily)